jgi:hypothetical protein
VLTLATQTIWLCMAPASSRRTSTNAPSIYFGAPGARRGEAASYARRGARGEGCFARPPPVHRGWCLAHPPQKAKGNGGLPVLGVRLGGLKAVKVLLLPACQRWATSHQRRAASYFVLFVPCPLCLVPPRRTRSSQPAYCCARPRPRRPSG